jgi:hypothetical protein
MMDAEKIISHTKKWITDVVIGCNFCPFAAREMNRDSVKYMVEENFTTEGGLQLFASACEWLDNHPETETILLIFPDGMQDFRGFLDLLDLSEDLAESEGYEGVYQVASFHPDYQFAGSLIDDPANFTNRSPYPMLHLLREESIEKALEFYKGDPADIPENNINFARGKGFTYLKMLRDNCLK